MELKSSPAPFTVLLYIVQFKHALDWLMHGYVVFYGPCQP